MWKVIATWDNFKTVKNPVSGCKHGEFASRKTTEKVFTRWVDAANYQRNCETYGETKEAAIKWAKEKGFERTMPMDLIKEIKRDPYNCIPFLAGVDTDKFKFGFQWRERD